MTGLVPRSAAAPQSVVEFEVRGRPTPQGSMRRGAGGGIFHSGGRDLRAWRSAIATEAGRALSGPPLLGPVAVEFAFRLVRPRSHYLPVGARRQYPELRLAAPRYHAGAPDIDKLARAALDALTQVVFADDGQVARLSVTKTYADDEGPGVAIRVRRLIDDALSGAA